jgi:hypothetical protein
MHFTKTLVAAAVSALLITGAATAAHGASSDADGDGIPTRWEKSHGMNPHRAADAKVDFDKDGLSNLREYRLKTVIRDEDTDNDGHDDGDEVKDDSKSTHVKKADTDGDTIVDGDEDADRDGIKNEDEDDAREACALDDDDRDGDNLADEDENEFGLKVRSADSNGDGILDGDEDADEDGEANEDADDDATDLCDGDENGDGKDDEDEGDLLGVIESFDSATGTLVVTTAAGYTIAGVVTEDTEIEIEDADGDESEEDESEEFNDEAEELEDREGTTADLVAGTTVAEIEFDGDSGAIEEIAIYATANAV